MPEPWGQILDTEQYIQGMRDAAKATSFIKSLPKEVIEVIIAAHKANNVDYGKGAEDFVDIMNAEQQRKAATA